MLILVLQALEPGFKQKIQRKSMITKPRKVAQVSKSDLRTGYRKRPSHQRRYVEEIAQFIASVRSYNPIQKHGNGKWFKQISPRRKNIPLSEKDLIEFYLDAGKELGRGFSVTTNMCGGDIDTGSTLHPANGGDLLLVEQALESLGITRVVWMTSSKSGGIHFWIFFDREVPTWSLACGLQLAMEQVGLVVAPGQLELFPNTKSYQAEYNCIRLPLMNEYSTLIDIDGNPICSHEESLQRLPNIIATSSQCHDYETLEDALKVAKKTFKRVQRAAKKILWLSDNQIGDIDGAGQTNDFLGHLSRIAVRLFSTVEEMVEWMYETCLSLPGLQAYSRHLHELKRRCWDWAKCTFKNFGVGMKQEYEDRSWVNDARAAEAEQRFEQGYEWAMGLNQTWKSENQLIKAIAKQSGISPNTIRKRFMPRIAEIMQAGESNEAGSDSVPNDDSEPTQTQSVHEVEGVPNLSDQTPLLSVCPSDGSGSEASESPSETLMVNPREANSLEGSASIQPEANKLSESPNMPDSNALKPEAEASAPAQPDSIRLVWNSDSDLAEAGLAGTWLAGISWRDVVVSPGDFAASTWAKVRTWYERKHDPGIGNDAIQ